jgi:hypothetical protein
MLPVETLRDAYRGKRAALVGKGTSLFNLHAEHLRNADIILALNHAILEVRKVKHKAALFLRCALFRRGHG